MATPARAPVRGPNWASGVGIAPRSAQPTKFELTVRQLRLENDPQAWVHLQFVAAVGQKEQKFAIHPRRSTECLGLEGVHRRLTMHRRNPSRSRLQLAPSAEWLTTQACAVALIVLAAGAVTGVIGAFAYALVKGLQP